ncbi:MAG TPA: ATP synthase subunit I [Burkholderiales bacterium]
MISVRSRPVRAALKWQMLVTSALTFLAGAVAGAHGALSALLGGSVTIFAGIAFAVVASVTKPVTVGMALLGVLRAEAVKILVIVVLLWLVLATYRDVVLIAFIGTFAASVFTLGLAGFVRDE